MLTGCFVACVYLVTVGDVDVVDEDR